MENWIIQYRHTAMIVDRARLLLFGILKTNFLSAKNVNNYEAKA